MLKSLSLTAMPQRHKPSGFHTPHPMQTYLSQLLDDLAAAAKNPPAAHYYDAPPHLEEDRQLSELAMVPYRTIEQLSGIKQEMFPLMTDLNADQLHIPEHPHPLLDKILSVLN